ncbi:MAG: metal-dependent transcriptional regulator [Candidatus Lokiarchaeota archaeon]|nr:metal-dependent transcriptional regulator [Candidatus Harpocratesius repetitus]
MLDGTLLKEKENQVLDFLFYWGRPIRSGDIAKELNIPHSTLNSVLKRLSKESLIIWEKYRLVNLTSEGMDAASHLSNHHFVIEFFLKDTLNLPDEEAHLQAIHLAGRVKCSLIDAICDKYNFPKTSINFNLCKRRDYPQH